MIVTWSNYKRARENMVIGMKRGVCVAKNERKGRERKETIFIDQLVQRLGRDQHE